MSLEVFVKSENNERVVKMFLYQGMEMKNTPEQSGHGVMTSQWREADLLVLHCFQEESVLYLQ